MTTRLLLASMAIALGLGTGSAFADNASIYSNGSHNDGTILQVNTNPAYDGSATHPNNATITQQGDYNNNAAAGSGSGSLFQYYVGPTLVSLPYNGEAGNGISQTGDSNTATIQQYYEDAAYIYQNGNNNSSAITQSAFNDSAWVHQVGANNVGNVTQSGALETAFIYQDANAVSGLSGNNTANIIQSSYHSNAAVVQLGTGNNHSITQH